MFAFVVYPQLPLFYPVLPYKILYTKGVSSKKHTHENNLLECRKKEKHYPWSWQQRTTEAIKN